MPITDPPRNPKQGHRLTAALLAVPLLATAEWVGRKATDIPHDLPLHDPVPGTRFDLTGTFGRVACYTAGPDTGEPPLLLVHSINAAGSAYEVRPIFAHYAETRPVYALDLPGYGHSDRIDRVYTPRSMIEAILVLAAEIGRRHGAAPLDVMALSLSCEFVARIAVDNPGLFRTVAMVSPTGFDRRGPRLGPEGSNRGMPAVYKTVTIGAWRRFLFDMLTSRVSIRYFLEKTFGSKRIDEGLFEYDYLTTHQPGAEFAPYSFISGFLFSNDITRIYERLALPVWMVHGTRGDFQDYTGKARIAGRPNWTIDVLPTGALPQFEQPLRFASLYDAFLARHGAT